MNSNTVSSASEQTRRARRYRTGITALILVSGLAGSGCSTLINRSVDGVANNLTRSIMDQDDPETVRQAIPAYMVLLDSFVQSNPENTSNLRGTSSLYAAYGSIFVEQPERASKLTSRSWQYAQTALCLEFKTDCEIRNISFDDWNAFLADRSSGDTPVLFDVSTAWLAFLQAHSSDFTTLAELPKAEALVDRLAEINDGYEQANIYLYLGILKSLRPPALGGDLDAAQEYFTKAIDLSEGNDLNAKVSYARYFARTMYERELHDELLNDVLQADPAAGASTLLNVLAQQEAQTLLDSADDHF